MRFFLQDAPVLMTLHSMNSYWQERSVVTGLPLVPRQAHHSYSTALWEQTSSSCRVYKAKVLLAHCPHDITSKVVHEILSWLSYPQFLRVCSKAVLEILVLCKNQRTAFPKHIIYSFYMNARVAQVTKKWLQQIVL